MGQDAGASPPQVDGYDEAHARRRGGHAGVHAVTGPLSVGATVVITLLLACEPDTDTSPGTGDSGDPSDTARDDTGMALGDDLLVTPGPEGTVSFEAERGMDWCRDNWQADARLAALMYYQSFGTQVVAFSPSDPDNNCQWGALPGGEASAGIVANAQYAPGWTYDTTADYVPEWRVDDVHVIAAYDLASPIFFALNPAQHRRQYGWQVDLEGVADNVPVILAAQDITGPEYFLLDAITGERYNHDVPDDTDDTGDTGTVGALPYGVVLTTTDGTTGVLVYVDAATGDAAEVMTIEPGAKVRAAEGYVLLLSPEASRLEVYSPGAWSSPVLAWDLGAGAEPFDVNYCSGDLWVTLPGLNSVRVIDPDGGADDMEFVFDDQADGDGNAEPSDVVCTGGRTAVGLRRFDSTLGRSSGGMALRLGDGSALTVDQTWNLVPNARLSTSNDGSDNIWAVGGNPGEGDGRVDWFDLGSDQSDLGLFAEAGIGGLPVYATAHHDATGILVVEEAAGAAVSCIDLSGWTSSNLARPGGTVHPGAIGEDGTAWLPYGEGTSATGVTAWDADTCAEGSGWATRLPATSVALLE